MVPKEILRLIFKENQKFQHSGRLFYRSFFVVCGLFLISCEEDIAQKYKNAKKDFPSQIIYNADMIERDSGRIKMKAKAPLIEQYALIDTPYVVARKGIFIEYWDPKKSDKPGRLKADYAKMIEMKNLYYARGNVQIITAEGQMFAMNSITWDKGKKQIFTRDTVYVNDNKGNLMIGKHGMTASDDFKSFTFYNSTGELNAGELPNTSK